MGRFKNFVSRTYSLDVEIAEMLDNYCVDFDCQKTQTVEFALVDYIARAYDMENMQVQNGAQFAQHFHGCEKLDEVSKN